MISDRRKRGNRRVMRRRSGTCCVSYRNRIRGWILVRRRLGKWKRGEGRRRRGKGRIRKWLLLYTVIRESINGNKHQREERGFGVGNLDIYSTFSPPRPLNYFTNYNEEVSPSSPPPPKWPFNKEEKKKKKRHKPQPESN